MARRLLRAAGQIAQSVYEFKSIDRLCAGAVELVETAVQHKGERRAKTLTAVLNDTVAQARQHARLRAEGHEVSIPFGIPELDRRTGGMWPADIIVVAAVPGGGKTALEPGIAALAALRAQEEHLADLRAAVDIMERSMDDADAYIQADNAFHLALARATGNALLMTLIEPMMDLLSAQRKLIFRAPSGPQDGQQHHKCILRAIDLHDAEAARACMESHMRQIRRDTGKQ